jgi:hypothetical protein
MPTTNLDLLSESRASLGARTGHSTTAGNASGAAMPGLYRRCMN